MSTGKLEQAAERWLGMAREFADRSGSSALDGLRELGRKSFAASGFPDTHHEEWQYANLTHLVSTPFVPSPTRFEGADGSAGVTWQPLAESDPAKLASLHDLKQHPLAALSTAFAEGIAGSLSAGTELEQAQVLDISASTEGGGPAAYAPRILFEVGEHARGTLIVREDVRAEHWSNGVFEIFLGENASLDLIYEQSGAGASSSLVCVHQERDSRFRSFVCTSGGSLTRHDLEIGLGGEGASCTLRGLFGATDTGVSNHHTLVDHQVPHCHSDEVYKGVAAGRGRGIFRGRIVVRPDAQKTRALQSNPNLVLDKGAEIDTKPQLEIYADDVRCTHGSTVGQLDPEALFFLRSRGLDPREAKALLLRGFATSVFQDLPLTELREDLVSRFLAGFEATP